MKQTTIGVFDERLLAEKAVGSVRSQLGIPSDDISFLYRDQQGEVREVDSKMVVDRKSTLMENIAMGAMAGAFLGALIGLSAVMNLIGVLSSVIAIGPLAALVSALGITGSLGTILSTTVMGALIGMLLGAVMDLVSGNNSLSMRSRTTGGNSEPTNIVVAVIAPEKTDVISLFRNLGAFDTRVYKLSI